MALSFILISMKNGSLLPIVHEFIIKFVWTKNFYHYIFEIAVKGSEKVIGN